MIKQCTQNFSLRIHAGYQFPRLPVPRRWAAVLWWWPHHRRFVLSLATRFVAWRVGRGATPAECKEGTPGLCRQSYAAVHRELLPLCRWPVVAARQGPECVELARCVTPLESAACWRPGLLSSSRVLLLPLLRRSFGLGASVSALVFRILSLTSSLIFQPSSLSPFWRAM
jgi:hypothetical protein